MYRDGMYSRRARIGVIAPLDDQVEYAFNKYAPDGVSFDSTRLWFPGPTPEGSGLSFRPTEGRGKNVPQETA